MHVYGEPGGTAVDQAEPNVYGEVRKNSCQPNRYMGTFILLRVTPYQNARYGTNQDICEFIRIVVPLLSEPFGFVSESIFTASTHCISLLPVNSFFFFRASH